MKKIARKDLTQQILSSIKEVRITALIGARQVGKSTLAHDIARKFKQVHFFDLEDPTDELLLQNPKLSLDALEGLIIIDEIQRHPDIFPYLRVKADKLKKNSRILILGSSSRDLIEKASESLAGRIRYIEITPFSLGETNNVQKLFERGGFPLSFNVKNDESSLHWRRDYIRSYSERDLKNLGMDISPQTIRRLLEMLAGYHGQIFNASEIGKSLGFSHTTARKYLDILKSAFLVRELKPWNASIIQRQVKQPKIYFKDSGLVNYLHGIRSSHELSKHPRLGSLWEGFAVEETIKMIKADPNDLYFWAIHQQAELDLLWINGNKKIGFEFKYSDHPSITKSMRKAIETLRLHQLYVIYPGDKKLQLDENIFLLPLEHFKLN